MHTATIQTDKRLAPVHSARCPYCRSELVVASIAYAGGIISTYRTWDRCIHFKGLETGEADTVIARFTDHESR